MNQLPVSAPIVDVLWVSSTESGSMQVPQIHSQPKLRQTGQIRIPSTKPFPCFANENILRTSCRWENVGIPTAQQHQMPLVNLHLSREEKVRGKDFEKVFK